MPNSTRTSRGIDLALAVLFWCIAAWLFACPVGIASDDALFFARGLERFSVLEFSPHFPGYPGIMLLGGLVRLLTGSGGSALQVLSIVSTLAVPPLAALIAYRVTGDSWAARCAFLITLVQPLLPLLGLSQLSDSIGVALFLLFLWLASSERFWLAGLALGFAFCCRPSYLALFASAWAILLIIDSRAALKSALGSGLVVVPMFGAIVALEGWAYLEEAQRFIEGHLLVWGNSAVATEHARSTWWDLFIAQPVLGLLSALCLMALWVAVAQRQSPVVAMSGAALLAGMVWTGLVQNPESLRHLAPLFVLTGILISCARPSTFRYTMGLLTVSISVWLTVSLMPTTRATSDTLGTWLKCPSIESLPRRWRVTTLEFSRDGYLEKPRSGSRE